MTYKAPLSNFCVNGYLPESSYGSYFDYKPRSLHEAYNDLGVYIPHSSPVSFPKDCRFSLESLVSSYDSVSYACYNPYNYGRVYPGKVADYASSSYAGSTMNVGRDNDHIGYKGYTENRYQKPSMQNITLLKDSNRYNNAYNSVFIRDYEAVKDIDTKYSKEQVHMTPGSPASTVSDMSSPASSVKSSMITFPSVATYSTAHTDKTSESDTASKKIHSCDYCDRKFARKYDVNRHSRIHTGKKPYSCPCCHKSFSRSDALNRHLRKEPSCFDFSEKLCLPKRSRRI